MNMFLAAMNVNDLAKVQRSPFLGRVKALRSRHALSGSRVSIYVLTAVIIFVGLGIRLDGYRLSLWNDEAWLANSVSMHSWTDTYFYPSWLQISPPLFLLIGRMAVHLFGLSHATLRSTPFALSLFGLFAGTILFFRSFPQPYAMFATALLALSPTAAEYGVSFKQYGGELSAVLALLLLVQLYGERPDYTRLALLFVGTIVAMLMAYPAVFFVPAITFVIGSLWVGKPRGSWCAAIYLAVSMAAFWLLYITFIRPNTSPDLVAFWNLYRADVLLDPKSWGRLLAATMADHLPVLATVTSRQFLLVLACLSCGALAASAAANIHAWTHNRWEPASAPLTSTCVLAIIVALGAFLFVYPFTDRTSLFLLPAWIVILVQALREISAIARIIRGPRRIRWSDNVLLWLVTFALIIGPVRRLLYAERRPIEDAAGAVAYLQHEVLPPDLLWVHSSAAESFKLYAAIYGWHHNLIRYGNTGWPCCPRGHSSSNGSSSEESVREDFKQAVPEGFHGRLWLLSANRAGHWKYVGLDELNVVRQLLRRRGCAEQAAPLITNMAVIAVRCEALSGSDLQ